MGRDFRVDKTLTGLVSIKCTFTSVGFIDAVALDVVTVAFSVLLPDEIEAVVVTFISALVVLLKFNVTDGKFT